MDSAWWDADDIALEMQDQPNIWTDGSREDFSSFGDFQVAGAEVYLPAAGVAFESAVWGVAEEYGDARLERCRAFMPWPCHLGIDNVNVARSIGRLLDRDC